MKPSQIATIATFEALDPERVIAYLLAHGWAPIHTCERGIQWFRNPKRNRWSRSRRFGREEVSSCTMIPSEVIDRYDVDRDAIVSVAPARFRDSPRNRSEVLADLERHEDRWRGEILEEMLSVDEV